MRTARGVVVRAHAKINLCLEVRGTRADGFHELRTIFQSLDLHDTLTFARVKGPFDLVCSSPDVPCDTSNLVWRAASALSEIVRGEREPHGVHVTLDKRIPVGGGLGGGSSDAAATLAALSRLWMADLDDARLQEIASTLGADVPYFCVGGVALGLGRGDELYPLPDLAAWWVVLVTPPFAVLTSDAYRWFDAGGTRAGQGKVGVIHSADGTLAVKVANDLERAVSRRHPAIVTIRAALEREGAVAAALSGSGSSVFGLFRDGRAAARASRTASRLGWRGQVARTLRRDQYRRRALPCPATVRLPRPAAIG